MIKEVADGFIIFGILMLIVKIVQPVVGFISETISKRKRSKEKFKHHSDDNVYPHVDMPRARTDMLDVYKEFNRKSCPYKVESGD